MENSRIVVGNLKMNMVADEVSAYLKKLTKIFTLIKLLFVLVVFISLIF